MFILAIGTILCYDNTSRGESTLPKEAVLLDENELRRLMVSFSRSTGLPVRFFSASQNEKQNLDSGLCSFCQQVQECPHGRTRCHMQLNETGRHSAAIGEPYICRCPLGVVEVGAAVFYGTEYLGVLLCGPFLLWEWDELVIQEILEGCAHWDINKESLVVASRNLPVLSAEQAQAIADMLYMLVGHVAHSGTIVLSQRSSINRQQMQLSGLVQALKRTPGALSPGYTHSREQMLLERMRRGDRNGAKAILNELLGLIFYRNAGKLDVTKARVLELIVVISRAAVENGTSLESLLGYNYDFIMELNELETFEDVCAWIVRVLDAYLDAVSVTKDNESPQYLEEALRYIRLHYSEQLTLEEVASKVHISLYYLSHLFKEKLGITFLEHLTRIRMEEACTLLITTEENIRDIAAHVGYDDAGYFSKAFKRRMKSTPLAYRHQMTVENSKNLPST